MMWNYERITKNAIKKAIRTIYSTIDDPQSEVVYMQFRDRFSTFNRELTQKLREIVRKSRETYREISGDDSKNLYFDWQIDAITDYYFDCLKAQKILEYEEP